jgi:hypothetical protein
MNEAKSPGVPAIDFVYVITTGEDMADPDADYWTVADIADHWGVTAQTVRTYRSRKRGELPEPDNIFGRSPVWRPATIIDFQRPGQGARTDLPERPTTSEETSG